MIVSPLIHFGSLENVVMVDLRSGASQLPRQLEHLTALISLHISYFDDVEALFEWFENFTFLETLKV